MTASRALLVDYGGVLTERMSLTQTGFCVRNDIDPQSLREVLREWVERPGPTSPVPALERGELDVANFESMFAERLHRSDGGPVHPHGLLKDMFADVELNEPMLAAVAAVRATGVRVAIVSNSWGAYYPVDLLHRAFDALVFSNVVGLRKPDPAIYLHSANLLGVAPGECLFVDDRLANVDGAVATGMAGLHFLHSADAVAHLLGHFGVTCEDDQS